MVFGKGTIPMLKIQYRPIIALLSMFLAIAGATPTMAQLTRGFVSGTINDPTSAILPSVQVVLTNVATGISRETVTNEVGFYRFAGVEPGQYKVDFSLPGFATITVQNVIV